MLLFCIGEFSCPIYFHNDLKTDIGSIIQEAGGFSSDMKGKQEMLETGHIIAGNPKLFGKLQILLKEHAKGLEDR